MSETELVDLEEQFNSFFPIREFSSFEEFEKVFREFQRATATSYVFHTSTSRELWQRRRREVIPENFRYKYVCLRCIHSTKKKRKPSTLYRFEDYNCPSKITLGYRENKMHLIHTDLKHNHPIAEGNPEFYSKNRRLSPEQEAILHRLLDGGFSPGQIIEYIYVNFGIRINMLDLRHILDRKRKFDQIEGEEVPVSAPVQPVQQPEPEPVKPEPIVVPVSITTTPVVNTFPCSVLVPTFVNSQEQTMTSRRHQILQVITDLYNSLIRLDDGLVDEHLSFLQSYTTHLTQSQCDVDEPVNTVPVEANATSVAKNAAKPIRSSSTARSPAKRSGGVKCVSEVKPQLVDIAPRPIAPRPTQSTLRPILPRPPDRPKVAIPVTVVPIATNVPTDMDAHASAPPLATKPSLDVTYDDENDEDEEAVNEQEEDEEDEVEEDEDEEEEEEEEEEDLHGGNISSSSEDYVMSNNMNSLNHSYVFTRNFATRRKPVLVTRGSPIEIIDEYIHR